MSSVMAVLAVTLGGLASGASAPVTRGATSPPTYQWPKIAHDAGNSSVTSDPLVSTSNAAGLGVAWMASTGATTVSSPVAAWSSTLQRTLVYLGNNAGSFTAFDEATGAVVWSVNLGSEVVSTPLVEGGYVWVSRRYSSTLYKLDAATGATQCTVHTVSTSEGSPTIGTPAGGSPTIYLGVNDLGTTSGPVYSINEANCAVNWKFTNFNTVGGSWDPLSFGTDVNGRSLVLVGTADPDNSVYAIDASTGTKVWSFVTYPESGNTDTDVGAGVTVSPPGVNGFVDGVAYVPGEDGYMFALNLRTGLPIWTKYFASGLPSYHTARATAALVGDSLVFGEAGGVMALSATNGDTLWSYATGNTESLAVPAAMGPLGSQVVAVSTVDGAFRVLDATTGSLLYRLQTPSYSTSSIADVDGNLLAASADGYLYDLRVGGGNGQSPTTTTTSPKDGDNVANPVGSLTLSGTASGTSIAGVNVAIQSGGQSGPWWNGATGTWTAGFFDNPATIASPGAPSTSWTYAVPVGLAGASLRVLASSYESNGVADVTELTPNPGSTNIDFSVLNAPGTPRISAQSGVWVAPGAPVSIAGTGFAGRETVTLSLNGTSLGTATASSSGALPTTTVTLPTAARFGQSAIAATGRRSGRSATASIQVSNVWAGAGYNALHAGFEPNDPVLLDSAAPGPPDFLSAAWSDPAAGAVRTSLAIANDVGYYGDDTGAITALNVRNGQPNWTVTEPSAVVSSPALAGSRVFFGTEGVIAGASPSVVALSQQDGSQAWSTPTTSAVASSPALSNGDVFVGSDDGTVYALSQSSGSTIWTAKLGGAIKGSPSVDLSAGLVVVGDAAGSITALSVTTGAVVWHVTTGGPVTATASIYGGQVFVGSQDGKVYALTEATGVIAWSTPTGSAISATGVVYSPEAASKFYAVGSQDGIIRLLRPSSGVIVKATSLPAPAAGLAASVGWLSVTTTNGQQWGLKRLAEPIFSTAAGAPFASAPTVLNGVVYVANTGGAVSAYSVPGLPIP